MAKKSADEFASRWAQEWEARSKAQLLERQERETEEGKQSSDKRRQIANRIMAEYRNAIAAQGRASWDQARSDKPEWQQFSSNDLLKIYGRR